MMEGASYQQKKSSPTALAVVVLMHGAGITALALTKMDVGGKIWDPPIVVTPIPEDQPPPEVPPEPVKSETPPPPSVMTHVPPVVPPPPLERIVESAPLPPAPPPPIPQPTREMAPPKLDPPAPPVEAKTVEPARARANLASYVSDEDYPSSAARNEEQGTTRFKLVVGADGRVKDCTVTSSSGSSALDSTTCRLMRQRAKFTPAKNNRGEPTTDTVSNAIRWVLPTD